LKALVTGATGFVGSHLVERLLGAGMEVACLMRPTSPPRRTALDGLDVERRIAALDDPDALARAVRGVDYVFHAAGLTRARTLAEYQAVNADGTGRLLEALLAEGAALRRFVYVSSLAAAGPARSPEPPDESAEPHPADDYGASKLAGEHVVLEHANRLPVTIVRPPAVYGPRDANFLPLFRLAVRLGGCRSSASRPSRRPSCTPATWPRDSAWPPGRPRPSGGRTTSRAAFTRCPKWPRPSAWH
jgi:nucleoside-diphosphate-sugar epimerase